MAQLRIPREVRSAVWLAAGLASAAFLVMWAVRLPDPLPADAPSDVFSTARAMKIVRDLEKNFGIRRNGSKSHEKAAEYLAGELRKLPGVAVELQRAKGIAKYDRPGIPFPPIVYETVNVIARIDGQMKSALLLNAHYDTSTEGPGAADDAMAVGAIIEAARALAFGPKPKHSVIINLNGGEEMCMVGASGFLSHPFAKEVRAYLYIDTGSSGKPVVIGAGPKNRWLLRTYIGAVPSPTVNVTTAGEDMADKGILPFTGDFVPFHEAGLVGIDTAALGGFHQIHSHLDTADNIDPGTFQLMGESLLKGARALLESDLPGNVDKERFVYYDVLGLFVPMYSYNTAGVFAAIAVVLSMFGLFLAVKRQATTVRQIFGGFSRVLLLSIAALLTAAIVAVLLGLVLNRPHGWYSAPWIGITAFGLPATAAALGIVCSRRRNRPETAPLTLWTGALVGWTLWLVITAVAGLAISYLPLWWTFFCAAGFIGAVLKPSLLHPMWLIAFVPGAALTLELVSPLYPFIAAAIGMAPSPNPLDTAIAGFVGIVASSLLPLALVPVAGAHRLGRAALVFAVLAIIGVVIAAVHFPYSSTYPKRVEAAAVLRNGKSSILIASHDALPLDAALVKIKETKPLDPPWSTSPGIGPTFTKEIPSAPLDLLPPQIDILSSNIDAATDTRTVRIRLKTDGTNLLFYIPRQPLKAWSLGEIPKRSIDEYRVLAVFENASQTAREITLTFSTRSLVRVELIEIRGPSLRRELTVLAAKLPSWVALDTQEILSIEKDI